MNKLKYVQKLQAAFDKYPYVILHRKCMGEIVDFTSRTGNEARFLKSLEAYLHIMSEKDISEWSKVDGLEKLKNESTNLWSMHFEGAYNLRILFSVTKDGTILLHTFYEKGDKIVTKYETHIPVAKVRLKEMQL